MARSWMTVTANDKRSDPAQPSRLEKKKNTAYRSRSSMEGSRLPSLARPRLRM
jgi:hypothetical protein